MGRKPRYRDVSATEIRDRAKAYSFICVLFSYLNPRSSSLIVSFAILNSTHIFIYELMNVPIPGVFFHTHKTDTQHPKHERTRKFTQNNSSVQYKNTYMSIHAKPRKTLINSVQKYVHERTRKFTQKNLINSVQNYVQNTNAYTNTCTHKLHQHHNRTIKISQ